jgi:myo-inositol 2-dehydrogenase/D-chiro-inositol 1-dehydrogenase
MLGIGLIGAGRIGSLHAGNIRNSRSCSLVAVFDACSDNAHSIALANNASVHRSISDLLSDPAVGAVFVCSPTDTHVDVVGQAARAGKAIFCEKPIDLDIARVRACLADLEGYPIPFTIGFHRRFDPHHRALRDSVRGGAIGKVEQIRIVSRDPAPPPASYIKRSGGIFRDMMIHDLDQCRFLLEDPFVGVFAKGSNLIDAEIGVAGDFDTATATFWTANGVTCALQSSRRSTYGFDQRIEVFGGLGTASLDNVPTTNTHVASRAGYTYSTLPGHFPQRYAEAYRLQLEAFVEDVETGLSPETTGYDGLMSLLLADAAELSARTGQPVTINP